MLVGEKEKSWSVRLAQSYIIKDQVRANFCQDCKSVSEIIVRNFNNPNLVLYGCKDIKCKHRLLRLNFDHPEKINKVIAYPEKTSSLSNRLNFRKFRLRVKA